MFDSIAAICFDLDDTLWPVAPAIAAAEQALLEFLGERYPQVLERHDLDSMRHLRVQIARESPEMSHDLSFPRRQALTRHAREAGYPESMAEEGFRVFFSARNRVELFPDVLPSLQRLGGRYRLLSLSNGNADLEVIGLSGYFELSLGAREAGAAKPDPRIFEVLLERTGLEPEQVLYVGDDPLADIHGARSVGMQAVWIDRFARGWPPELPQPACRVSDLAELVELLA